MFSVPIHSSRSERAPGDRNAMAEAQDAGSRKGWGWLRQVRLWIPVNELTLRVGIRSLYSLAELLPYGIPGTSNSVCFVSAFLYISD